MDVRDVEIALGIVVARGCTVGPSSDGVDAAIAEALDGYEDLEGMTKPVRGLLRHGRYKPTGRGKPASEYLLKAAREGRFPRINHLVDALNLASLATLLPISLIDLGRAGTSELVVRRGRAGESYVFNAGGQTIDLEDLLLTATLPDDEPCANPVKDSLRTKIQGDTTDVLVVIYSPVCRKSACQTATDRIRAAYSEVSESASAAC